MILDDAPYGPNVEEAKVRLLELAVTVRCACALMPMLTARPRAQIITLQTLLTILNTTKATEITGVIKSLSLDTQDTLMKYLYKGMAMPGWGDVSGSVLLGWHEKVRGRSSACTLLVC